MKIQFKQDEIVAALKQYITQQGISLAGKSVDISFTAKRTAGGLEADIQIEDDFSIPGYDDCVTTAQEAPKAVLTVVPVPPDLVVSEPPVTVAESPVTTPVEGTKSLFG